MFDTIAGLPVHVLVVHATEVVVPVAAVAVLLAALWPRFRRWAAYAPAGLALAGLVLVPVSTQSGEALEGRVGESALVEAHAHMADGLLPWVAGLALVALVQLWRSRSDASTSRPGPRWWGVLLLVAALVTATGTVVEAVRIGHSGATAVWSGTVDSTTPATEGDDD